MGAVPVFAIGISECLKSGGFLDCGACAVACYGLVLWLWCCGGWLWLSVTLWACAMGFIWLCMAFLWAFFLWAFITSHHHITSAFCGFLWLWLAVVLSLWLSLAVAVAVVALPVVGCGGGGYRPGPQRRGASPTTRESKKAPPVLQKWEH